VKLTRAAIRTGRQPVVWKSATSMVIFKPGKDDNTKLKAYCAISLLSCKAKVVGKVVAELLSKEADRRGLMSNRQSGSRTERSAIHAVANTVHRAHAVWTNRHIRGLVLMDIIQPSQAWQMEG